MTLKMLILKLLILKMLILKMLILKLSILKLLFKKNIYTKDFVFNGFVSNSFDAKTSFRWLVGLCFQWFWFHVSIDYAKPLLKQPGLDFWCARAVQKIGKTKNRTTYTYDTTQSLCFKFCLTCFWKDED